MSATSAAGSTASPYCFDSSAHALLGAALVEEDAVAHRLVAEHDVLGDRHHRDQHEVLVHHADAGFDRVLRGAEDDGLALQQDLPLVGLVEAVEDVHERRLAGAVLAEEGVHLALAHVEADVVVGDDAREPLRDPTHLEDWLVGHAAPILTRYARGAGLKPAPRSTRSVARATWSADGTFSVPAMIFAL